MGLVLRLVETGADSRGREVDVLEISRPKGDRPEVGGYAASARCRPELGTGSNTWPNPEPRAPL
jgi:hypothetical protein